MTLLRDRSVLVRTITTLAISACFASIAMAQSHTPPDQDQSHVASREGTQRLLHNPVTIQAQEATLRDVLAYLETVTPLRFEPVWVDEKRVGLDPDSLVSLDIEERPMLEAINRLLEQIGDDFDQAAWQIGDDGRVQIGPKSRLNERTTIVIYDLNDVLFGIPDYTTVPEIDLQTAMQQGQGTSQPPFRESGEGEEAEPTRRSASEIVDLITLFIESDQWHRNGGDGALLRVWNNQLIVKAPRYVLRGIDGLL